MMNQLIKKFNKKSAAKNNYPTGKAQPSLAFLLTISLFSLSSVPAAAAVTVSEPSTGVIAYADNDMSGAAQEFAVGVYDLDALQNRVGNDTISSITIPAGYVVTVYADRAFGGYRRVLTRDCRNSDSLSAEYWGNPAQGSLFGQPLLSNGPSGPEAKEALNDYVKLK